MYILSYAELLRIIKEWNEHSPTDYYSIPTNVVNRADCIAVAVELKLFLVCSSNYHTFKFIKDNGTLLVAYGKQLTN